MLIGISSGTGLVLINILLIACCLHKRHKKNLKGGNDKIDVLFIKITWTASSKRYLLFFFWMADKGWHMVSCGLPA